MSAAPPKSRTIITTEQGRDAIGPHLPTNAKRRGAIIVDFPTNSIVQALAALSRY
jgi:hypothetical protein